MSTFTLLPASLLGRDGAVDGTSDSGASWATASDSNVAAYTGDASDTTGIRADGSDVRALQLALSAPTIPADEFVCRVGGFLRWSHGQAGKQVSCSVYRIADGIPGAPAAILVDGRTTPTTSEPDQVLTTWTAADCAALALQVAMQGDATAANRPRLWELGATVYTLKLATAAPQATTSIAAFPEIPVDVSATIGWEAATYNWQLLRKVSVEVRVESGGTGVGTGTLVSTATTDLWFTATGTVTVNVTLPDSLPNGAYKAYARATRHRDNETTTASDQVGPWSTSAVLTVILIPPTAPTVSVTADDALDRMTVTVTPPASSGYTTPFVSLERSVDGVAWTAVRDATAVAATFDSASTLHDYEAPRGVAVSYRATVSAYTVGVLNTSPPSTPDDATLLADTWNLKCPQSIALNIIGVTVTGEPAESTTEDLGVFRPLDRTYPVIVSGTLGGWDGDLTVHCASAAEWAALKVIIESGRVVLLESPFGWAKYIRIQPGTVKSAMKGSASLPRRVVTMSYVETSTPVGTVTLPASEITIVIDGGDASTSSWADTIDGGDASTTSWAGVADGGSAS